ncbi:hypothetical protein [Wielerella bovis]|uniref:hypothetical protein n=1 Tax=Wielerella bovis TaxID=2917790 RepID=UPI002018B131|nr:hypothetical protein [Wielerella bovis]MCG7657577.1 hypothetical protein [Wielerella bovis]MCG7659798.1 hypothetical protein [Wielerella bovis]ULJ68757.1 hypothetical protein MIS45_08180 [Wielerella bovis]
MAHDNFQAALQYTTKNDFRRSGIHARHDESRHIVSGINARPTTSTVRLPENTH